MFLTKKATSLVEVIVMMVVLLVGIVGMYKVYSESNNLSESTKNKITAIQIAREGIEAVKNIRGTNWILYSADTENCWNNIDYQIECVGDNTTTYDIKSGFYSLNRDTYNRWHLKSTTSQIDFKQAIHKTDYKIELDDDGFYTQSGGTTKLLPLFTRYIKINYLDDGRAPTNNLTNIAEASNEQKMEVHSVVQRVDSSSPQPHKVDLSSTLTNWKE